MQLMKMTNTTDFSNDNVRIIVLYRVEPGCLGPDGKFFIEDFCAYANDAFKNVQQEHINWLFVPRHDKSLPEIQYQYKERNLSREMAQKLFSVKAIDIDEFEDLLNDQIPEMIDKFLER